MVDRQRPDQVVADAVDRVERGEGVLKDHLDLPRVTAGPPVRHRLAVEQHHTAIGVDDLGQHPGDGGLSRAALPDQGGHGSRCESDRDVVHREESRGAGEDAAAMLDREVLGEAAPFQHGGDRHRRDRGLLGGEAHRATLLVAADEPRSPGSARASSAGTVAPPEWSQQAASRPEASSSGEHGRLLSAALHRPGTAGVEGTARGEGAQIGWRARDSLHAACVPRAWAGSSAAAHRCREPAVPGTARQPEHAPSAGRRT